MLESEKLVLWETLFNKAKNSGATLFFNEADALFGKRSEVKDVRDRYANMEVDYLLQRMEDYPGLSILATNRKSSLEPAFLRLLHYMVFFPRPNEKRTTEDVGCGKCVCCSA